MGIFNLGVGEVIAEGVVVCCRDIVALVFPHALNPLTASRQIIRKKNRALGMGQQDTLAVHLWRLVNYKIVWR